MFAAEKSHGNNFYCSLQASSAEFSLVEAISRPKQGNFRQGAFKQTFVTEFDDSRI
jgi:hypothetical protein